MSKNKTRLIIIIVAAVLLVAAVVVVVLWQNYSPAPVPAAHSGNPAPISGSGGHDVPAQPFPQVPGNPEDISAVHPEGYYGSLLLSLKNMEPDVQYKEYEVLYETDLEGDAGAIAEIIGGELLQYSDGVAVIGIPKTVLALVMELDRRDEQGFELSLNYLYTQMETEKPDEISEM